MIEQRYELSRQGFTGLACIVDRTIPAAGTGLTPNVVARQGPDGTWRPTKGHGRRELRAALAAVGPEPPVVVADYILRDPEHPGYRP
jgi:hypothetical protein